MIISVLFIIFSGLGIYRNMHGFQIHISYDPCIHLFLDDSQQQQMRQKINSVFLKKAQQFAKKRNHPLLHQIYQYSYLMVTEMLGPVNRKFNRICIHGNYPELFLPQIKDHLHHKSHINFHSSITFHSNTNQQQQCPQDIVISIMPDASFQSKSEHYDLIISCLEGHHGNFEQNIKGYMQSLKPDGALVGCMWAQNTLKELHWAYMLAENERCGGISPKVFGFPSIGSIGNVLQNLKIQIPTIMVKDIEVQVQSVIDVLTLLQIAGENGILNGRRKAVFPDLLLAMSALYDSEFNEPEVEQKRVKMSLELAMFIGWKYHESQAQPLSKKKIMNKSFLEQLRSYDPELETFTISESEDARDARDAEKGDNKDGDIH